jgi:PAS domain S-box-containing protein
LPRPTTPEEASLPILEGSVLLECALAAFEESPDSIALTRLSDDVIVAVNRAFLARRNLPAAEVVGRTTTELGTWRSPDDRRRLVEQVQREGVVRDMEFSYVRPDGTTTWLEHTATLVQVGGEPHMLGISRDVTGRKQAERRVELEHERLAVTLESIGDAVIATDTASRITILNPTAEANTGWPAAEALGRPLQDVFRIVNEETRAPVPDPVAVVLEKGITIDLANHSLLVRRDGSELPIADTAAPIRHADGTVQGVVLVFRDQSAQRAAERARAAAVAALGSSEAWFRALTEKSTDMVFVLDEQGRFTFWSRSATECLGWTAEEVLGRSFDEVALIHPDDRHVIEDALRDNRAGRPRARVIARNRHRDGSWRILESSGRNLLADPGVRGVVVNLRDVTEQRALEEQVRQAQKLESVGRLAGGIAHDFNNLLTAIVSCAEALRESAAAGSPIEIGDVEQILSAGWRARDLTRQLLAFARKQVIAPVLLDLNEVVRTREPLFRRVLGEDVVLEVELSREPCGVVCDRGQVEQVLMNLLVNSRDAMPTGGKVVIRTFETEANPVSPEQPRAVRLVVRDTGQGMSEEVRSHLFEPFFTTKPPGKGTGLGLATVYGIMAQSGGSVRVDSTPPRGTSVELSFPHAVGVPAPSTEAAPRAHRRTAGERVLLVEDDALVRAVTLRALTDAGYRVLVASSGEEALQLVRTEPTPPEIVVTDVVMPGMSGRDLVDALRREWPGLRALFMSGYSGESLADRGVLGAGLEFLPKPFTPAILIERVRAILDRG